MRSRVKGGVESLEELRSRLREAASLLKESLNLSVDLFSGGVDKSSIGREWSEFLEGFFEHVKQKSRESRQNLLTWIRFPRA